MVLACLDVAITAAYNCSSSFSVVGDSCLVRGDILQCQARVVDICTDDPQCKWRILLFLCRGVCKKMTCTLRILSNDETFWHYLCNCIVMYKVASTINLVVSRGHPSKKWYSLHTGHQAGAYPGFCSMKRLGVFLLPPGWDASPLQGYPHY